jgi:hypothetical protein
VDSKERKTYFGLKSDRCAHTQTILLYSYNCTDTVVLL